MTWIKDFEKSKLYIERMKFEAESNSLRGPGEVSGNGTGGQVTQAIQRWVADAKVRVLDVRSLLSAGEEPFPKILQAIDKLAGGEVLKLEAPFEPMPLYAVLGRKGYLHWAREAGSGQEAYWEVFFYREEDVQEKEELGDLDEEGETAVGGGALRELDVRELEPPEPLEEVLSALESLVYGEVLLVHHHRNPLILFDLLHERGYAYRTTQKDEDYWQIRIWRRS